MKEYSAKHSQSRQDGPADHQVGTIHIAPLIHECEVWVFGRWAEKTGEAVQLLLKFEYKDYEGRFQHLRRSIWPNVRWLSHDGNTKGGQQAIQADVWKSSQWSQFSPIYATKNRRRISSTLATLARRPNAWNQSHRLLNIRGAPMRATETLRTTTWMRS